MEDPEEEWGMEEYYPCSSGEDECQSKVGWIWNRGLKLGKKVVITGAVISSAPLVLPPLVFVSALGFAVSVPFGVVFASYACTEKIMSKLLPMPVPSPFWEYESLLMDETDEESEFGGEIAMEKEVKKQMGDVKEEIEMRIELVEDGNKEQQEGDVRGENDLGDFEKVEGEKPYKGESLKDKGYEEDVGEYLEGEDEGSLRGLGIKTEGTVEEVDKKPLIEESKNEKPLPEVKRVIVVVGEERKNENAVTKPEELVVVSRVVKSGDVKLLTGNEEHNLQKEGTASLLDNIRDKGSADESVKKNKKKNKHHSKKSHGIMGKKKDKHGKNVNETMNEQLGRKGGETIPEVKKKSSKEADEDAITKKVVPDVRSSVTVSLKPPWNEGTATNGNRAPEHSKTMGAEVTSGEGIQESGVNSKAFDKKERKSNNSSAERKETEGFPKPKHDGVTSEVDAAICSNKITPSEEKIWDQMNALRVIVGYKAARHKSCIEELKALYIFTGVEPPSSFHKATDLIDAEDKLHFLMSIVGVK